MRRGFTLVELSIVLVIIGLLIGGILVAQSMISTSRITAQVAQLQQFDAGVMNFKTKYNYLPGDAPAFGGDGNNVLNTLFGSDAYEINGYWGDIANFWNNLDPQTYVAATRSSPGTAIFSTGANKNVPIAKLGVKGAVIVASGVGGTWWADASLGNFYAILPGTSSVQDTAGGQYSLQGVSANNAAVSPPDLLALDKKMDDGIANAGGVRSGGIYSNSGYGSLDLYNPPLSGCSIATNYKVENSSNECTPFIRIGSQAGDPQ